MGDLLKRYRDFVLVAACAAALGAAVAFGPVVLGLVDWLGQPAQVASSPVVDLSHGCVVGFTVYDPATDKCILDWGAAVVPIPGSSPLCPPQTTYISGGDCISSYPAHTPLGTCCGVSNIRPTNGQCLSGRPAFDPRPDWRGGLSTLVVSYLAITGVVLSARALRRP